MDHSIPQTRSLESQTNVRNKKEIKGKKEREGEREGSREGNRERGKEIGKEGGKNLLLWFGKIFPPSNLVWKH